MNWEKTLPELIALPNHSNTLRETLERSNSLLHAEPGWDWVGFYLAEPNKRLLHLGPYLGEPTDHTRIAYGKGICGQVAESEATYISDDVQAEGNYIACSIHVRSEIVSPVFTPEGTFIAQLDVDSHRPSFFSAKDREAIETWLTALGKSYTAQQWEELLETINPEDS